jgi:NifU-like protein involved in Fe-S cluster formation
LLLGRTSPEPEGPTVGRAKVTGDCGDTMELSLAFSGNRVDRVRRWTNGCANSLNALDAACRLSRGKTPEEIMELSEARISEEAGGLPDSHAHCAALAYATLQAALEDYLARSRTPCGT